MLLYNNLYRSAVPILNLQRGEVGLMCMLYTNSSSMSRDHKKLSFLFLFIYLLSKLVVDQIMPKNERIQEVLLMD